MNILYLNADPRNRLSDKAGYATHMLKTIKGFELAGHHVFKFIAGEGKKEEYAKNIYQRFKSFFPQSISRSFRDIHEILHDINLSKSCYSIVYDKKIDFIYERMTSFHACGIRLAKKLKIPFVLEINDPLRESISMNFSSLKYYAIFLEDHLVRKADIVILGSHALQDYYINRGFNREKLVVLYPTADFNLFDPKVDCNEIKRKYKLDNKIVIGFVAGNISSPWRRITLMIRAIMKICKTHPNVIGIIVGKGDLHMFSEEFCFPELSKKLKMTGIVPYSDVPKYIASMDICIIPNATWYGSPTKLFEYAALAKPVIAPKFPPIMEIIDDGDSGLLFTPEDENDLVNKAIHLLDNPKYRQRIGIKLRKKLMDNFTWEKNTQTVVEHISKIKS